MVAIYDKRKQGNQRTKEHDSGRAEPKYSK